jgi:hypothetical protein
MAIRDDIRKFGRTSAWLAGIAGLYLGAKALHADWVFFAVLALAGVIVIIARLSWVPRALRSYGPLLEQVANLQEQARAADEQLKSLSRPLRQNFEAGIAEGRAQVIGAIRSLGVSKLPEIRAIKDVDGIPVIVARDQAQSGLSIGARFFVEDRETGEIKGVVEVTAINHSLNKAELSCVEYTVPRFWDTLLEKAMTDSSPPKSIQLGVYSILDESQVRTQEI